MKKQPVPLFALLCLVLAALTACSSGPLRTALAALPDPRRATSTPLLCPQPTAEFLWVAPLTSPTREQSQVVAVHMGNMEWARVTTESGVFTANDGQVEVRLLPDTTHHLAVEAKVREMTTSTGCSYGGYTLDTATDANGAPLIIVQGEPPPPVVPAEAIGVENIGRLRLLATFSHEAQVVAGVSFLGSEELFSVGYGTGTGRIYGWSLVSGQLLHEIEDPAAAALAVAVSPDGRLVATGGTGADPAVRVWDVQTGEMRELGRHDYHLESIAFSPSGALLASGDNGDTVRVWNLEDGKLVASFTGDVPGRLQSFSGLHWADEATLIGGGSNAIYQWDVGSSALISRVPAPEGVQFLVGTAMAAGGNRIAAVAQDSRLYLWDGQWSAWQVPEGGATLATVAFGPDERLVAAATYEDVLYVWDAASGTLLSTRRPAGPAAGSTLRFSPDGRYLVTGGREAPIRVWGVP